MDQEMFSTYLKDRYQDQVQWYDAKASQNQKTYRRFQWALIGLSTVTPALVGLQAEFVIAGVSHSPAIYTSVAVAVLTASLKTFKFQENWINYRTTCETLRKERHLFDAGLQGYGGNPDREALFVNRVEALISQENTLWLSVQEKQEEDQSPDSSQA